MRRYPSLALLAASLLLLGFAKARIELPSELATVAPETVTGHNPRTWNRPIGFGPWRTVAVREGATRSWSLEAFGLGGGASRRPYELTLEGPAGERREVACLTRGAEVWRGSLSVDLSGITKPRLVCLFGTGEGAPHATLVLGQRGVKLEGHLRFEGAGSGDADRESTFEVASIHRFATSRITSSEPLGYTVRDEGGTVAVAVETINRGRVWLAPPTDDRTAADLAAAAAALLLFEPEISQR